MCRDKTIEIINLFKNNPQFQEYNYQYVVNEKVVKFELWMLQITYTEIRNFIKEYKLTYSEPDGDIIAQNIKLAKEKQYYRDKNRIEHKSFRKDARIYNAIKELNDSLIEELKIHDLSKFTIKHDYDSKKDCIGIIHLTDLHLNELINLRNNKYDFNIASKRLKLLMQQSKEMFNLKQIKTVVVAFTGDILNADSILDKTLNNATNRTKACLLACHLLSQFLIDLNSDFNVVVASVSGNETRLSKDIAWSDIVASDNYDFMLYNMLRYRFFHSSGIKFIIDDPLEQIVKIFGYNVLLVHGHQFTKDTDNSVRKIIAKYANEGIIIDLVLFGHLHQALVSDNYARGSSMCGQNAYSDKGLQLFGRASQNIIIYYRNGNRDIIKIDLQNIDSDLQGYDIIKELEEYNTKSHDKVCKNKNIYKIAS